MMDFDTQVKLAIYNHFAATGHAPSPDEVVKSVDATVEKVLESYQRLRSQRLLVLEPDESSIRMAPPLVVTVEQADTAVAIARGTAGRVESVVASRRHSRKPV